VTLPLEPQHFVAHVNTDKELDFTFDPVVNITSWAISWKLAKYKGGTVLITKSATVVSGAAGTFKVVIDKADWDDFAEGRYVWEAYRSDSGSEDVVSEGTCYLSARVG
jgi:hypothetical protein